MKAGVTPGGTEWYLADEVQNETMLGKGMISESHLMMHKLYFISLSLKYWCLQWYSGLAVVPWLKEQCLSPLSISRADLI